MTDKEAIKYLQQLYPNGGHCWLDKQRIEAIGMAIDALSHSEVTKISDQQEPISEDFEMALAEMVAKAQKCVVEPWVVAAQWKDYLIKLAKSEEPVSEKLEKAAVEAFKQIVDSDKNNFLEIFKAGAKWQKTKNESITEDLGEYINELSKQFPEVSFAKLSRIVVRVAKWQKEQMMAKAIDGDITFDYYGDDDKIYGCIAHNSFCLEDFGLKDRDKVKVIVIKED